MNDNNTMVDFIKEYNFANNSITLVAIESIIIALIFGVAKQDIGWGIGTFIVTIILYGFPLLAGVFSLTFSFVEAMFVYGLLITFSSSNVWAWAISLFAFLLLVQMHRSFGNVQDVVFGYSLIIFEALLICGCIYLFYKNIIISILIFIGLLIMAFIPVLRVIELIILVLGTTVFMYLMAAESLTKPYSIAVAIFVFLYTSSSYINAYLGVDYKGYFESKKAQKLRQECIAEEEALKNKIYEEYPDLEKQYYYFYREVCQTNMEKIKFDFDWINYLSYIDSSKEKISFNQYFEKEKLYRTSSYNRDFAKKCAEKDFFKQQKQEKDILHDDMEIVYFAGIGNVEDLKRRYHDLLKIYHPDNQNGDITVSQNIQREYEFLLQNLH